MKIFNIIMATLLLSVVSCEWFLNEPPKCFITNPLDSMHYDIGETIEISVEAEDSDGKVAFLRFYINNIAIAELDSFPWTYIWNTAGLHENSYKIKAIAYDNDDASDSDEIIVYLVNSAPVPIFTVIPENGNTFDVFTFDATQTHDLSDDSASLQIRWDWTNDGIWDTNYSPNRIITHSYSNPGTYTVKMEVKDSYDLTSDMTLIVRVEAYNSPPTAKLKFSPDTPDTGTEITFDASESFDMEDNVQALVVRWDFDNDGNWDTGFSNTKTIKHTYINEGTYTVRLEVRDSGGLTDDTSRDVEVTYENQPPTAVIEYNPRYGDTQTQFTFSAASSFDLEDNQEVLEVRWDWKSDGNWDTGYNTEKTATHRYSNQGTFTVSLEVKDSEGLTSIATKDIFVSDYNSAPTAKFTVTPQSGDTETLFNFDASGSFDPEEETTALQVRWDWEDDGAWDTGYSKTKTITHQYSQPGTYCIKMEVIDSGELTDSISHIVTVSHKNEKPVAVFTNTPEHGTTQTIITFDASASYDTEDESADLKVRWDWESDGTWDTGYSINKTVTHSFNKSSTYTVTLEVMDTEGAVGRTTNDIFIADHNSPPTPRFTFNPLTGNTETQFTFNASASFDDEEASTNLKIRWDWENDGIWDTGYSNTKTANHTFRQSGTYNVKLEVKDSGDLTNTLVQSIEVSHKNQPPVAVLTGTPNYGTIETVFTFDATGSSDPEDSISDLLVRWDWENDGIWDTGFDTSKIMNYSFIKNGNYTVKVEVRDTKGLSDFDTKEVFISQLNTAPFASFIVTPESGDTETLFAFNGSGSYDNEESTQYLQVRWDWENDGTWDTGYSVTKTATHRFTSAGTYRVVMEIRDSGELTDTSSQLITVSYKNNNPIAVIECTPPFGNTETVFTFNASNSSDKEDLISDLHVRWDFENDGIWNTYFDTTKTITHTFPTAGTYNVKLEVIDTEGLTGSNTVQVIVANINTAPVPIAEVSPLTGNTRTDFTFDASRSYDKEDLASFLQVRWDFENDSKWDSEFSTNKTIQYRYNNSGTYAIKLRVRDRGGLSADTLISVLVEDFVNTSPIADFTVNPQSGPTETLFQFDASSSYDHEDDITDLEVRWDWENDGIWDTGYSTKKTANHVYNTEGTYTVKLEVRDSEGLTSIKIGTILVLSTNTAPIAVIDMDTHSGTTKTVFTFDASGSSDAEDVLADLQVRWDWESDGVWDTGWSTTKTATHTFTTAGNFTVTLEVRDTQGLTATDTEDIFISTANTAPTAVFTSNYSTGTTETVLRFDASDSYDAEDFTDDLEVRWDWNSDGMWDTPFSTTKTATHRFNTAGTYNVTLQVKDTGGLTDDYSQTYDISEYSNHPPMASFTIEPLYGNVNTIFTFDASGSSDIEDEFGNLLYIWDWNDDGIWDTDTLSSSTAIHRYSTAGYYTVRLKLIDTGLLTDEITRNVLVEAPYNNPPVASFKVSPESGYTNTQFTFDASESDDYEDGNMLFYRWDWENDGIYDTDLLVNPVKTHQFHKADTYTIKLLVIDSGGLKDSTYHWNLDVSTTIYTTPTAIFTVSPNSVDIGEVFTVDASGSFDAEDGYDLEYRWDWEDDRIWDTPFETIKTKTHSYDNAGQKNIRLEVRNNSGIIGTTTKTIAVNP